MVIAEKANQEEKARQAISEKKLKDAEKKFEEKQRVHREYMADAAAKLGNTSHPSIHPINASTYILTHPHCMHADPSSYAALQCPTLTHPNLSYPTTSCPPPAAEKQTTQASQELEVTLQSEINELNLELARAKEKNISVRAGGGVVSYFNQLVTH